MDVIIDIETAPIEFGSRMVKDEETGEDKDIGALSPITGRVTALGWRANGEQQIFIGENEKEILEKFWRSLEVVAMKDRNFFRLIGFSIKSFDIHFLMVRSLHHNVRIAKIYYKQTIDLRDHLTFFNSYMKKGTLHDYAKLIGIEGKHNGLKGKEIPLLWKDGKLKELEEYLAQDLFITESLYKKCRELSILGDY